jgi:hypothetical protein
VSPACSRPKTSQPSVSERGAGEQGGERDLAEGVQEDEEARHDDRGQHDRQQHVAHRLQGAGAVDPRGLVEGRVELAPGRADRLQREGEVVPHVGQPEQPDGAVEAQAGDRRGEPGQHQREGEDDPGQGVRQVDQQLERRAPRAEAEQDVAERQGHDRGHGGGPRREQQAVGQRPWERLEARRTKA